MPKICLNMIVRNEADRIERALASVFEFIDCAVIVDTGSTDNTVETIREHFDFAFEKKPLLIETCEFENFSQARNFALETAIKSSLDFDYLLLMDADMELHVATTANPFANLNGLSYDMLQQGGSVVYGNRRLMNRHAPGRYVGVTHEYLDVAAAGLIEGAWFIDHADGSNRTKKYDRDIKLLQQDLKRDPGNVRSWFYLAQSYRDAGFNKRAAKAYLRRAQMGGWDEEVWNSMVGYAHALKADGNEDGFVAGLLTAHNYRPTRAEALYDLALHYREKPNAQVVSTMFSERGMDIPLPKDMLFVDTAVYSYKLRDEFSITAWYDPAKRDKGFDVTDKLSLDQGVPEDLRGNARARLYHYLKPLSDYVPSFSATVVPQIGTSDWPNLNPSITQHNGKMKMIIRSVNYRIADDGSYQIRGDDGSITRENPINTRNWIVDVADDLSVSGAEMLVTPFKDPPAYELVRGLEDMRLISTGGKLLVSATCRELIASGVPQQVLVSLDESEVDLSNAMSDGSVCEKNWMPYTGSGGTQFMYRLGKIVNAQGKTLVDDELPIAVDTLNGGTQLIPFFSGFLALVHEAGFIPGKTTRYYQHRFVWWDATLKVRFISRPFYFHDRVIEFASGLCWHPDGNRIVISYGFKDEEARLCTVEADELREMVFHARSI